MKEGFILDPTNRPARPEDSLLTSPRGVCYITTYLVQTGDKTQKRLKMSEGSVFLSGDVPPPL